MVYTSPMSDTHTSSRPSFARYCFGKDATLLISLFVGMVIMAWVRSGVSGLVACGLFAVACTLFSVACYATRKTDTF